MNKKILLLIVLAPFILFGQDCDCRSNFEWVKKTIEKNDAGFQFAIDKKGVIAYEQHNKNFAEKIAKINSTSECQEAIYQWLIFFRSGHISFRRINQEQTYTENNIVESEIIDKFRNWEKMDIDLEKFESYLLSKAEHDYEGVWVSKPYKIGIKKSGDTYYGFIIDGDGVYWRKGQIKLKINEHGAATFFMRDHTPRQFETSQLIGDNYLKMGTITLRRIIPDINAEPEVERYIRAISAESPYFERIDNNTVLLRIPVFYTSEKRKIDSVIKTNRKAILNTPNLIIDIRNNGGGADRSFQELLPFLYTNPIRTVGVEMFSTPLNNQRMLDFINKEEFAFNDEEKKWAQQSYDKLSKKLGEFVLLSESQITKTTFGKIYEFPKNIGIIVNHRNGSTTEQFLLAAKQSKKVKLFGTTTSGVLDISNMHFVKSPCEQYQLGYCLSKSLRIPEMTIDDKGIQPDYYIDKEIPRYKWIQFVTDVLND